MNLSGILAVLLLTVGTGSYWYYKTSQATIIELRKNEVTLSIALQTSEETIKSLETNYARAREEIEKINEEFRIIRVQNNILAQKLQEHDLGVLGATKPGLVQRTINNASAKALRCFELLSGAELTDKEKEATNAQTFNSECPWLYSAQ